MADPARGEVWWVDFEPTLGSEANKRRPALVISVRALAHLPVRVVVPLTSWQEQHSIQSNKVRVAASASNGLVRDSAVDILLVRAVSLERFSQKIGRVPQSVVDEIAAGVAVVIGVPLV